MFSTGKVSINTQIKQNVSDKTVDLRNCTKIQVDLGNCIVENNRFHPCDPIPIEVLNQNILKLRKYQLDEIMKAAGENVVRYKGEDETYPETRSDGRWKIYNCSKSAFTLAEKFKDDLIEVQLPEPFESVKNNLKTIRKMISVLSFAQTDEFTKRFNEALDRQVISNPTQVLNQILKLEKKFKNPSDDLKAAFEKLNDSLKPLLAMFPSSVPQDCVDQMQRHTYFTNLTKMLIIGLFVF
jgi:hypothetical protein